ncbi:unnamed protein product [Linum tenue]|uniref:Uncharacterized protein n=1 Tax=Linum tenue TaxID=586396 RepID=A0AAV0S867_9ROSI|nr:unnamed protein product [Linum tenue]
MPEPRRRAAGRRPKGLPGGLRRAGAPEVHHPDELPEPLVVQGAAGEGGGGVWVRPQRRSNHPL